MNPYELVAEEKYPRLFQFLQMTFQNQLSDIRVLLRLPYAQLKAGCNIALINILFNLIGGISVCLYYASYESFITQTRDRGERFKGVLKEYFPWDTEEVPIQDAIELLYYSTRNPLIHVFGLYEPNETQRNQIVKKRLTPKQIEEIERSEIRPPWLPPAITLSRSGFYKYDINVLSLYWGVFRLISSLLKDKEQLDKSEEFQMHLWHDYNIKSLELNIKQLKSMDIDSPQYVEQVELFKYHLVELNRRNLTEKQQQAVQALEAALRTINRS